MRKIWCTTWNHLGDTLLLGAALRNLELSHGEEFEVCHTSNYQDVFAGWDYVHIGHPEEATDIKLNYGGQKGGDKTGVRGTIQEAYTRTLGELLKVDIPFHVRSMPLFLTEEEKRKYAELAGCVILNANCQQCSMTKRYPHWQEVSDMMSPHKVVLIGGTWRDVRETVRGTHVVNLRDKTSVRDLIALCSVSRGVISPPSGIVHLAAALGKPAVYLTGAREPIGLMEYKNCIPIASSCQNRRYHPEKGCIHLYSCEGQIDIQGAKYPGCFAAIRPEDIVAEAKFRFWGRY